MSVEFCDTNLLVYANHRSEPAKQALASALVGRLWTDQLGAVSVQVLQELYVTLSRRVPGEDSRAVVTDLATHWQVHEPSRHDVLAAIGSAQQWQLSFWDAM